MKINYYFTIASLMALISFSSCNKDEVVSPAQVSNNTPELVDKASNPAIITDILDDLGNRVYYRNETNPYDYSHSRIEEALNNTTQVYDSNSSYEDNYTAFRDYYSSKYSVPLSELDGYDATLATDLPQMKEIASSDSAWTVMKEFGYISNVERDILVLYSENLAPTGMSEAQVADMSSIFIHHINNDGKLTTLQKRTLLTTIDVLAWMHYCANNDLYNMGFIDFSILEFKADWTSGSPSELDCGGTVILGIASGAVLGNGPGAAVGLITGLWGAYTLGCMD